MKTKNALNDEQKQLFRQTVEDYVTLLNMRDWRVNVSDKPATKGCMADCSTSLEDRLVVIMIGAVGWDNVPSMGYSGHTLDRGAGRLWDVTQDTSKLRSRFAAFDPARRNEADLLGRADPNLLAAMAGAGLLGYGGYQALKD